MLEGKTIHEQYSLDFDFFLKAIEKRKQEICNYEYARHYWENFDFGAEIAKDFIINDYYRILEGKVKQLLNHKFYEFRGEKYVLGELAKICEVNVETLRTRLNYGWSVEIAMWSCLKQASVTHRATSLIPLN